LNPAILYFSRTGSAFKALFFLGFAVTAFLFASLRYQEDNAPPQIVRAPGGLELPMRAPHRGPLAPFEIPLLIGAGCGALFYVGRHGARSLTRQVAAKIEGGNLHFHPSYGPVPAMLPVENVEEALFDRADRLPGEGPWSAKLAARFRHGLHLSYRNGRTIGEIRLIDNDIDGGAEQLRRFAAQIEAWRQPRVRTGGG
jgi:hypothetical protein